MYAAGISPYANPTGAGFDITNSRLDQSTPRYKAPENTCNAILRAGDPATPDQAGR